MQTSSKRIPELAGQVRALQGIGYARREAVRFVAQGEAARIKKSLPEINKPLPTPPDRKKEKWTEKTDRLNEQQSNRPASKGAKPEEQKPQEKKGKDRNIKLQMKPRKPGDKRPLSPFVKIIEKQDGTKWMYVTGADGKLTVKQLDQYFVPTFVETKAGEEGKQDTKPAKSADTEKGKETMQKSDITSRWGRSRSFEDIAKDVSGIKLQSPVQNQSNGGGGIDWKKTASRMSTAEHQQYLLEQARLKAAEKAERDAQQVQTVNASWMGPTAGSFRIA